MKIAVASGKGGTGKTMVATSLANSLATAHTVQFIDCDVEAPNAHLFLKPQLEKSVSATIKIPVIDEDLCILCGMCVDVCEFHALAMLQEKIILFPQLCHGCGSCS
jgi:MinD superfamily P-loop ATPase